MSPFDVTPTTFFFMFLKNYASISHYFRLRIYESFVFEGSNFFLPHFIWSHWKWPQLDLHKCLWYQKLELICALSCGVFSWWCLSVLIYSDMWQTDWRTDRHATIDVPRIALYTGWQWRNFVPYLCKLVFATILWVKLREMFVTAVLLKYVLLVS